MLLINERRRRYTRNKQQYVRGAWNTTSTTSEYDIKPEINQEKKRDSLEFGCRKEEGGRKEETGKRRRKIISIERARDAAFRYTFGATTIRPQLVIDRKWYSELNYL